MPAQQDEAPRPDFPLPKKLADYFNDLADWLEDNRPVQGSGTYLTDADGGGKAINVGSSDGSSPSGTTPFQLLDASDNEGNKIRVVYGTINSLAPDGFSPGDTPIYVLDVPGGSTAGFVYLEVTTDTDGNIDSRSVGIADTIPDDTDGDYHEQVGSYFISDTGAFSIAQAIGGSQHFELCGGVEPLWGLV